MAINMLKSFTLTSSTSFGDYLISEAQCANLGWFGKNTKPASLAPKPFGPKLHEHARKHLYMSSPLALVKSVHPKVQRCRPRIEGPLACKTRAQSMGALTWTTSTRPRASRCNGGAIQAIAEPTCLIHSAWLPTALLRHEGKIRRPREGRSKTDDIPTSGLLAGPAALVADISACGKSEWASRVTVVHSRQITTRHAPSHPRKEWAKVLAKWLTMGYDGRVNRTVDNVAIKTPTMPSITLTHSIYSLWMI